jgi:hypothetical protein
MKVTARKHVTGTPAPPTLIGVIDHSVYIYSIIVSCVDAGSSWNIGVQDRATPTPFQLVPVHVIAPQTDGVAQKLDFTDHPAYMDGGIDINSKSGTPGTMDVWIIYSDQVS